VTRSPRSPERPPGLNGYAIRSARAVFEDAGCIYQPVDGSNDIGKDAYIDIVEGNEVTGELIALQIKGGGSYKRANGYGVPCSAADRDLWRTSSIPIFGIVHDPTDQRLHWTNLTGWARSLPHDSTASYAPVNTIWSLDARTIRDFLSQARAFLAVTGPPVLLDLASEDPQRQRTAILDAFAFARHDPKALLLVRAALRYFRDRSSLRLAIHVLALTIGHGDIFWHAGNWLPRATCEAVPPELRWTWHEAEQLIGATAPEEWDRGGLGQDVSVLLDADPDITDLLESLWVRTSDVDVALRTLLILVSAAGEDGLNAYDRLIAKRPDLMEDDYVFELRHHLADVGFVSMW
jgi:hypothetical protein